MQVQFRPIPRLKVDMNTAQYYYYYRDGAIQRIRILCIAL